MMMRHGEECARLHVHVHDTTLQGASRLLHWIWCTIGYGADDGKANTTNKA
jgi:hypothetical protein